MGRVSIGFVDVKRKSTYISLASSSHQRHITLHLCKKASLNLTGCYKHQLSQLSQINKERCTLIKYTNCTFLLIKINCIFRPWTVCPRIKLWTMASYTWYIPGVYSNICTLGIWVVCEGLYKQVAVTTKTQIGINAACWAQNKRNIIIYCPCNQQIYRWLHA